MRNIAIQQKGQVQEVQVAVKDEAQEAQEARVNCEEANVSQKLLLKDVKKKAKKKVKMKKKKFCSLLPNKKPTNTTNPTYSTNLTKPNNPNNCLPKHIHYNNFNNFNFNKASKAKQPLLVAKCLPLHHLHRYSST